MKVVSLFDGMSCGQIALKKAGKKVEKYYASEIDKYGQIVSKANFPETVYLGDVRKVDGRSFGKVDLFIGGSPCQSFSFAGKRKGMVTKEVVRKSYTQEEFEEYQNIYGYNNEFEDWENMMYDLEVAKSKTVIEILTLEHYLQLKADGFEFEGQSYLFWEYMRVLTEIRETNPEVKFLLENVMMGDKWQKILTQAIGINPICINSSLLSAQNRQRLYWTNIGAESDGLFGDLVCKIPQPKDKGILLKDILETEVDEKYFLSAKSVEGILKHKEKEKEKGNGFGVKFHEESGKMSSLKIGGKGVDDIIKINKQGDVSPNQNKASCFTAGVTSGGNHSDMDLLVHNMMPRSGDKTKGGTGHLTRSDGKTYCLDTSGNTNSVEFLNDRQKENFKEGDEKANTLLSTSYKGSQANGMTIDNSHSEIKSGTLRTHKDGQGFREVKSGKGGTIPARAREDGSGQNVVSINSSIRRLTPLECERLQTVPDNYTNHVSDTQRYKMLGNGWTCDVIAYIFSFLK